MATITLDPATNLQVMKAWEGTAQIGQLEYPVNSPNYEAAMIAAALDLGINRVRVEVLSGLVENTTDYYQLFLNDNSNVIDNLTPTSWANVRANRRIPVNDNGDPNTILSSGFKWAHIDRQITTVVEPLDAALQAQGETLDWHICYVHFSASNRLHITSPAEYGELMLAVWQHCDTVHGRTPTGLEIFLEPDNTAAVTASEFAAMVNAAYDRITGGGFPAPYIVGPSTVTTPACLGYYQGIKAASALAGSRISEVSRHRYGTQPEDAVLSALVAEAYTADGKVMSMLETGAGVPSGGNTYTALHQDVKVGMCSAWEQFTMGFPSLGGAITDDGNQYFIIGDGPGYALTMGNRTKYLRHYMKYIRAGAQRKGITSVSGTGSANVDPLFFRNPNGKDIVVMKFTAGATIDALSGLSPGTYGIRYTTGDGSSAPSAYDQALSNQTIGVGQDVTSLVMPNAGVMTVFDTAYLEPSDPVPTVRLFGGVRLLGGVAIR
jgi:hypothetical protein